MKNITVTEAPLSVTSGKVKLSADQVQARRHALHPVDVNAKTGAGVYEVRQPIQFKRGETFGFDGDVGKNGVLSDPEAEELARREAAEKSAAQTRSAEEAGRKAGAAEARTQLIAELRKELTPVLEQLPVDVQAALEAPILKVFGPASDEPQK